MRKRFLPPASLEALRTQRRTINALRPLRLCGENYSSGFSLLEVLVAMAIMVVIIVMVTNMFRDASEAWDMGAARAEMNTSARAALEYIARELSCAVAGSFADYQGDPYTIRKFKLANQNDAHNNPQVKELYFTALSGEDGSMRGVRFKYDNYAIVTANETASFDPYIDKTEGTEWFGVWNEIVLITNVWRFAVTVCSNEAQMAAGAAGWEYDSSAADNINSLPACVDISIEMLSERDMARVAAIGAGEQKGFVMTNSRVYTARVCFPNRESR